MGCFVPPVVLGEGGAPQAVCSFSLANKSPDEEIFLPAVTVRNVSISFSVVSLSGADSKITHAF